MQSVNGSYRRTSTLDTLKPSGNGMADADRNRLLMGINRSKVGQSDETFDKSLWLGNTKPVPRYENSIGG